MRQSIYRGVGAIAAQEHIPMIDVAATFATDPSPGNFYAYPGSHFNPRGYQAAAEAVAAVLDRVPR
jgi:lysophospholipase L1-like esterase